MAKAAVEPKATTVRPNGAAAEKTPEGVLVQLALDQIALDPITDVRTGPKAKDEDTKIDNLAKSMFEQGQIQPVVVRRNGAEGSYLLVAGRRRFAAKKLIAEKTNEPVMIDAIVVDKTDEEAWVTALQENLQRRQFSPIELAQNITEIRKRKGWDGEDWSRHVADFLRVSRATVTQHAKLLDLPKNIQAQVHRGDLSAQSAFDLYAVEESKRNEVLAKATELAEEEAEQAEEAAPSGKRGRPKGAKGAKAAEAEAEPEKGKVKRKHILEAARQSDALTQVKPRTRGEILGFFQAVLDSTDPYAEPIVDLFSTMLNRWATGQVGDRALYNKLNAIHEMIVDKPVKTKPVRKSA